MVSRSAKRRQEERFRRVLLSACVLLLAPGSASAFELSGGVSMGVIVAGRDPRFAVTPHGGVSWRTEGGFQVAAHDLCSILPATNRLGAGVYNRVTVGIGYASETTHFSIGPSLAGYSMPACGASLCGRVVGVAAGGYSQASLYFAGPFGASVSASVDWIAGRSRVLPGNVAATLLGGLVIRWSSR